MLLKCGVKNDLLSKNLFNVCCVNDRKEMMKTHFSYTSQSIPTLSIFPTCNNHEMNLAGENLIVCFFYDPAPSALCC